jgi:hypothetical protein
MARAASPRNDILSAETSNGSCHVSVVARQQPYTGMADNARQLGCRAVSGSGTIRARSILVRATLATRRSMLHRLNTAVTPGV